jgi:hypothetical protein
MVSVFLNRSSGQRGIVLANVSDQKQKVSFQLDLQAMRARGRLVRLKGQPTEVDLKPEVAADLEPYEVAILGVDPEH